MPTPDPLLGHSADVTEARAEQARIVALVRERGFKDGGGQRFSDAQVWQAVMDSRDWGAHAWDAAAGKLMEHVIEGRTPPSSPTYREGP